MDEILKYVDSFTSLTTHRNFVFIIVLPILLTFLILTINLLCDAVMTGQLKVSGAGSGGRTARLYYGVQTPDDLCFVDKFPEWESMGFQVVPVLSQPPEGWSGRTGYVQNCLEEDGVPIPRNSGALLCGMKGMAESVKDLLMKAGVFEGRILTNF